MTTSSKTNMNEDLRKEFNKTRLVKEGGSAFECSDYEGIVEDMFRFIETAITKAREEGYTEGLLHDPNYRNQMEAQQDLKLLTQDR